jgi:hypothetical protein
MLLTLIMTIVATRAMMVAMISKLASSIHIMKLKMKNMNMTISVDENNKYHTEDDPEREI